MVYTAANAPSLSDLWTVYTLASSFAPDTIRYVGITNDLRRRINHHISESRRYSTRKARWVASVIRDGGDIIARIDVANVTQVQAKRREIELIASLRAAGSDLTNLTEGGDGTVGRRHTAEARERMAKARSGTTASEETRRKMSQMRRGKPSGRLGEIVPERVRAKIAASLRIKFADPAERKKISDGLRRRYEGDPQARKQMAGVERRSPPKSRNKSGFKGVSFCNRTQKWVAQIKDYDRQRFLGRFKTAEEAARAYDSAANAAWGRDCYLNFGSG